MAAPLRKPNYLTADKMLRTEHFTERRELGVLNVGGNGAIHVGKERYALENLDGLYIGRGATEIAFESSEPPTKLDRKDEASPVELGSAKNLQSPHRAQVHSTSSVRGAASW